MINSMPLFSIFMGLFLWSASSFLPANDIEDQFARNQVSPLPVWDVENYHNDAMVERTMAGRVLQRLTLRGNEAVLDVGCGEGSITAMIAAQLPRGRVVGVDICSKMLDFATKYYSYHDDTTRNLKFLQMDGQQLSFQREFDLVVSFSCLHWISDLRSVFAGVNRALKLRGSFVTTFPASIPKHLERVLHEVMQDPRWKDYFNGYVPAWNFLPLREYVYLLHENGLELRRAELTKFSGLVSHRTFRSILGVLIPHQAVLPQEIRDDFMDALVEAYLDYVPSDPHNQLYFQMDYVDLEAYKSVQF